MKNGKKCSVTAVKANAFLNCSIIKSVDFKSVRTVYSGSFKNCTSLKTIYFGNVQYIYSEAFAGCSSLTEIHLGTTLHLYMRIHLMRKLIEVLRYLFQKKLLMYIVIRLYGANLQRYQMGIQFYQVINLT